MLAYHLGVYNHVYEWPPVRHGDMAVDFFFVLSGFVIAHATDGRLRTIADVKIFMIKRLARIYPLHAFTLAALAALEALKWVLLRHADLSAGQPAFSGSNSVSTLLGNLALINGVGAFREFTWNVPSWSISAEFWTYVVFAGLSAAFATRFRGAAAILVAASLLALGVSLFAEEPLSTLDGQGVLRCLAGFFAGILVHSAFKFRRPSSPLLQPLGLVAAALGFFGSIPVELGALPFALFVYAFTTDEGPLCKALQIAPLQWLGRISFSIYLVHFPVITVINGIFRLVEERLHLAAPIDGPDGPLIRFQSIWAGDLVALAIIGFILLLSTMTSALIELPAQKWALRRFNLLTHPPASSAPTDALTARPR